MSKSYFQALNENLASYKVPKVKHCLPVKPRKINVGI